MKQTDTGRQASRQTNKQGRRGQRERRRRRSKGGRNRERDRHIQTQRYINIDINRETMRKKMYANTKLAHAHIHINTYS